MRRMAEENCDTWFIDIQPLSFLCQAVCPLEFPEFFLPKVEAELKIVQPAVMNSSEPRLVRIKEIEYPIRDGVIKEAWNSEKSFRHQEDSFDKHL